MVHFDRILITGAAGRLGTELRTRLTGIARSVRISDREPMTDVKAHEDAVICDLGDHEAVMRLTKDVDAILHFGGSPLETDFETILHNSIRGSYHIYEGARRNNVKRVVYASSVHAVGYHTMEANIDADAPVRPDTLYGVSKCFVEALSRLYWDKFGVESVCLRIFSSFPEPTDRRMLWSWLSFADCARSVESALLAPRVGHTIAFATSDNSLKPYDNRLAGHLGLQPRDSSEPFRAAVEMHSGLLDSKAPGTMYIGGWFCELGHPDDVAKL